MKATFNTNAPERRKFITILVNGYPVRLQLDTASDITIISEKLWRTLGQPPVHQAKQTAISACGGHLQLTGQLNCCISFRGTTFHGTCYVTSSDLNLLGLDWFERLGLADIPISSICNHVSSTCLPHKQSTTMIKNFDSVFQPGLGHCKAAPAILRLRPGATPVFRPKRPVPYASMPEVDAELQRLEREGVLIPVSYSAWAAPIVVVKKPNGTLRICADFSTGLNEALQTHHYPLPMPEDLFTTMNGGKFFAKLDLAEAYLQVEVAQESRELLTINTHRGLFQHARLPFGIKTAPAIFQQLMDTILAGLPGVAVYLDDVLIVGSTADELRSRTENVLHRVEDAGFRLRPEKCNCFLQSVKFLGFIFDADGRHPDPENIKAIQRMPAPKDVSSLRSFLGLISYYSAFLSSLHDVRQPLNRLLGKDIPWFWSKDCEAAFCQLKSMLSSDLLLTHYDPKLPIVVAADASAYGVGAVILHVFPDGTEKAVMHASRTLTAAEKRYGQIEKEALALVFAVRRFHKLVYGRKFTLLTDHKPLLSIFGSKTGIPAHSANRLQRWALILLGYDFDIQYRRTETFGQADALSRLISDYPTSEEEAVIAAVSTEDYAAVQFASAVRALPVTSADVQRATDDDSVLQEAIEFVADGWPTRNLDGDIKQLFHRRSSLCVVNRCLMFGDRVVIPCRLRAKLLRQFHFGHPGISRMKSIARSFAYWPGMDHDIETFVKRCSRCQQAAKNPPRQPPIPWPQPEKPWSRLHLDFAGPINGVSYLVLVDAYSKWPDIVPVTPPTTFRTLQALEQIFNQHGFPETLVSDNGSQFTSREFETFCSRYTISHIRSPPYHPQSNGQAERFVDTFKRALQKSRGEGTSDEIIRTFLFVYRTTPSESVPNQQSPAEALMGRKLRTVHDAMLPKQRDSQEPPPVKLGSSFEVGSPVYARDYRRRHDIWIAGDILNRRGNVMYEVAVGRERWTRHQNQLRPRSSKEAKKTEKHLPLDILLDTFKIPALPLEKTEHSRFKQEQIADQTLRSRRQSTRKRKQTVQFQMNPKNPRY